jgi:hypothetical protein
MPPVRVLPGAPLHTAFQFAYAATSSFFVRLRSFCATDDSSLGVNGKPMEIGSTRLDTLVDFEDKVSDRTIPEVFWAALPMGHEFDRLVVIYIRGIYYG